MSSRSEITDLNIESDMTKTSFQVHVSIETDVESSNSEEEICKKNALEKSSENY